MVKLLPESITRFPTVTPMLRLTCAAGVWPLLMHTLAVEPLGTTPVLQFDAVPQLVDVAPVQIAAFAALHAVAAVRLKLAVTVLLAFIVTMHVPVPEHAPAHPINVDPASGEAVNVTIVP